MSTIFYFVRIFRFTYVFYNIVLMYNILKHTLLYLREDGGIHYSMREFNNLSATQQIHLQPLFFYQL